MSLKKRTPPLAYTSHLLDSNTTTINLQVSTRHKLAILTNQESHYTRYIVGATEAIERRLLLQLRQLLLAPAIFVTRRLNNARVDSVDADTEGTEFLSGGEGNAAESEFGGAVRDEVGEAA